jgi:hypothetical protein
VATLSAMYTTVATVVVAALLLPLAIILIRFNLKRRHIIHRASSAGDEQLEAVYALLDRLGPEPACAVLARTNRPAADQALIPIPGFLKPWDGRVVALGEGDGPSFTFVESAATEASLRGKIFRTVPMPPIAEADWEDVSTALVRFVEGDPPLKSALLAICPKYPAELLQYLLSAGLDTFELDPMHQVQLGGSPAWVQDEEFPSCAHCRKQMSLILQMPGTLLPGTTSPRGTFFFFGCSEHPEHTKMVAQFT